MNVYAVYPYAALVGQELMELRLLLNIITLVLFGVLNPGEKFTEKFTALRPLADILPQIDTIQDRLFQLPPGDALQVRRHCANEPCRNIEPDIRKVISRKGRVVKLPVGAQRNT